jgi:hypothetical protein
MHSGITLREMEAVSLGEGLSYVLTNVMNLLEYDSCVEGSIDSSCRRASWLPQMQVVSIKLL